MSDFCPQCGDLVEMASHSCRYPPQTREQGDLRRVEVLREGVWSPCRLWDVRKGERFRMFGAPGDRHMSEAGEEFVAEDDGYRSDERGHASSVSNIGGILAEPYKEVK